MMQDHMQPPGKHWQEGLQCLPLRSAKWGGERRHQLVSRKFHQDCMLEGITQSWGPMFEQKSWGGAGTCLPAYTLQLPPT